MFSMCPYIHKCCPVCVVQSQNVECDMCRFQFPAECPSKHRLYCVRAETMFVSKRICKISEQKKQKKVNFHSSIQESNAESTHDVDQLASVATTVQLPFASCFSTVKYVRSCCKLFLGFPETN